MEASGGDQTVLNAINSRGIQVLIKLKFNIILAQYYNLTLSKCFEINFKKHPEKVALISGDRKWTFKEVEQFSNQVANYFSSERLKAGDEVALFMPSIPENTMIFLGLSKIGVKVALINENLRMDPLIHSITCVNAKAVIFDAEFENAISDAYSSLKQKKQLSFYCYGELKDTTIAASSLSEKMKEHRTDCAIAKHNGNFTDVICYIYTSGTTGLPKAAIIRNSRFVIAAKMKNIVLDLKSNDITYNALPLYHTIGAVFGVGASFVCGQTVVISRKFSASRFWEECYKYNCTVAGYIGEVCRYLLAQPDKPTDKLHKVRKLCGVGLRPTIWKEFVERFNIDSR
ncbi:Long-chain fatty acid transport protein 1-like protein [Dinothrombium tinctorium]|uniref:Long-chain-fatty-acid--CoA ligase n=1 Tax=Dinothrombium tinctorium TaxID=1965070 RepID=A0A3S3P6E9_9ACAR|nr:Long-chain fatty acid transport protein 1-like protein [Dinothrombium tinctorium]RWS13169.1 Long-chain fatty acid transport protein 1-like protein [Dinothrombium tinctorium]